MLAHVLLAQTFSDNFDDGNLTDGLPLTWDIESDGGLIEPANGDLVIRSPSAQCCPGAWLLLPHEDISIETVVGMPQNDIFVGLGIREGVDDGPGSYWAGARNSGEIAVGYTATSGSIEIARRGVFLPSGAVTQGTDVTFELDMVGNELTFTAFETELGLTQAATITWIDTNDRFPTGDGVYPFINPTGHTEGVAFRSFSATLVPEPSGFPLATSIFVVLLVRRSRRSHAA